MPGVLDPGYRKKNFMRKLSLVLLIVLCASGWIAAYSLAEAAPAKAGQVNPEEVLRQMADYIGKLPAFSCKVESVLEVTSKIHNNRTVTKMTVRLERPNRLAMIVDEGLMGLTVVSDGKQLIQYLPMMKRYAVKDAPADFTGVTDIGAPMSITMLGMSADAIPTSGEEFYKSLMNGVTKSEYLGKEKVGDVECHHCRFIQEEFDWDVWIEVGKRPLVHKAQPDLTKQLAGAGAQLGDAKISYVVTISDWNVAPKFTDADFAFTPPADAQKVDALLEAPQEAPHPLLGQAAPPFATTDVEGHPIDLKKHLGKNVVLLDFWATWCGPCVEAMPQVEEVAKKYKEKGLVFYAVNVGEEAEAIKKFLTESKLDPTVAMDTNNEISQLYKVEGIPQTLLIGKDGKVQVVHVGYSSALSKMLTKEIENLLAGKDLASETLSKAEEAKKEQKADAAPAPPADEEAPADKPIEL
jgi:peroxiredoxin